MALKVFDLQCANGHVFEGWFSSHDDFHSQQDRGLLNCPICDCHEVVRQVSASRINTGAREPAVPVAGNAGERSPAQWQAQLLQHLREVLRDADNVGERFVDEARRIHEGEAPQRSIRGTATLAEYVELAEEGIAALPVPAMLDDDRLQ